MKLALLISGISALAALVVACSGGRHNAVTPAEPGISPLDFTLIANDGSPYDLARHRGQVLVIVNTASRCGFTGQYEGLEALYQRYKDQGLVVIAVPSNDFLGQEPGSNEQIAEFCRRNYGVSFPLMAKAVVKGEGIIPLYRFLTEGSAFPGSIPWNFTKFVVGRDGALVGRFGPRAAPLGGDLEQTVVAALQAGSPEGTGGATTGSVSATQPPVASP